MPVQLPSLFAFADWTVLLIPAVGLLVAALVPGAVVLVSRLRRKRQDEASKEEDLDWESLLALLSQSHQRKKTGEAPDVPDDVSLEELLARLPAHARRARPSSPEELEFLNDGKVERRAGRRRWGNPIEVQVTSPLWHGPIPALVVNRSTGGVAIVLDREVPNDVALGLRSVEAPGYVPAIEAAVRHCRKAGKNFILGCQFTEEIPWNVRVWFG